MAKLLKLRRGTTSQHGSFTGAEGEVTIDTTKDTAVVHDGSTAGGRALAREDLNNVSSSTIAGRLNNDSIAVSKIAAGTLPSDVKIQDANISGNLTIESADIVDGTIATADIANNAVTNAKIQDVTIATAKLADNAVTNAKINDVNGSKIAAGTVSTAKLADLSVTTAKIAADAITNAKIANDSIDSEHYVDGSIDTAHIANDAVTFAKLENVASYNIVGRISGGTGNPESLSATNVRSIINVEDGATADQTAAEIRTLVESASDSNVFTDADHTKLNGIEASATADQTAAEIRTLVESASDSNVFTDADHTKLNGIEASATADQTASEILGLITSSNIYTSGNIGRDSNDHIVFTNDSRLDVVIAGNNEFRFQANGEFHADGDITAFSSTISSDKKLKENIQVVPNALDKVQALNGVTFDWKRDGTPSAGVIAQEVQAILPEAVKEVTSLKGGDSHLAVNYHALTSILIESIKELKAEIDELKGGK